MKLKHIVRMSKLEDKLVQEKVWLNRQFVERFNQKIDSSGGPDACWPWLRRTKKGYGEFMRAVRVGGKRRNEHARAHRIALLLGLRRPLVAGKMVIHSCDNPICCNPQHLREGTAKENWQDCIDRGRNTQRIENGESHRAAVLTEAQVIEIRKIYRKGEFGFKKISRLYPVTLAQVKKIIWGQRWKEILEIPKI